MTEYNIILDDTDYTAPWDKFSKTISDSWPWDDDTKSLEEYETYFNQAMIKEEMIPDLKITDDTVRFNTPADLILFLLKWS